MDTITFIGDVIIFGPEKNIFPILSASTSAKFNNSPSPCESQLKVFEVKIFSVNIPTIWLDILAIKIVLLYST